MKFCYFHSPTIIWASMHKNLTLLHGNNKDVNQPAHAGSLIKTQLATISQNLNILASLCSIISSWFCLVVKPEEGLSHGGPYCVCRE